MKKLSFQVPERLKREFMTLLASEGETVKSVLSAYVYCCIEFGIIDACELIAENNRLRQELKKFYND